MKIKLTLVVIFILSQSSAVASDYSELFINAEGMIEIGRNGAVTNFSLETDIEPPIDRAIVDKVSQWRFEPIVIDGRTVIAKSRLHLSLKLTQQGDEHSLHIVSRHFGGAGQPREVSMRQYPMHFPPEATYVNVGARVVLAIHINERGRVTDVHPYQTSLSAEVDEVAAKKLRRAYERTVVETVRRWRFDPVELVDGKPVAGTFLYTSEFLAASKTPRGESASDWRAYIPGPIIRVPWLDDESGTTEAAERDGESRPMTSRLRLTEGG